MTDQPQRVDVERLSVFESIHGAIMEPNATGEYVRYSDYAALLQQLADYQMAANAEAQLADERGETITQLRAKLAERDAEIERLMTIAGWGGVSGDAPERLILASEMFDDVACCDRWIDVRRVTDNGQQIPQTATAYVRADKYEAVERDREGASLLVAALLRGYGDETVPGDEYHDVTERAAAFLAANGGGK